MAIKCLLVLPISLLKCIKFVFLIHREIRLLITQTAYQQNVKQQEKLRRRRNAKMKEIWGTREDEYGIHAYET